MTFDKDRVPVPEACKRLKEAGADVVGINCFAGPDTFIPMIKKIKEAVGVSIHADHDIVTLILGSHPYIPYNMFSKYCKQTTVNSNRHQSKF